MRDHCSTIAIRSSFRYLQHGRTIVRTSCTSGRRMRSDSSGGDRSVLLLDDRRDHAHCELPPRRRRRAGGRRPPKREGEGPLPTNVRRRPQHSRVCACVRVSSSRSIDRRRPVAVCVSSLLLQLAPCLHKPTCSSARVCLFAATADGSNGWIAAAAATSVLDHPPLPGRHAGSRHERRAAGQDDSGSGGDGERARAPSVPPARGVANRRRRETKGTPRIGLSYASKQCEFIQRSRAGRLSPGH